MRTLVLDISNNYLYNRNGARGIHTAAQKGHVGVINAIILKGEDVNVLTNHNFSALHLAIEAGRPEVVECLLGKYVAALLCTKI